MIPAARVHRAGQPPEVVDVPPPAPGGDEVVVDVLAAPITPLDVLCAGGRSYFGSPAVPYTPGVQGVGVCEGRVVWFPTAAGMAPGDGSMATRVVVARASLVPLPGGVDPVLMAALGLSAVAAYSALVRRGGLVAGEQVIVLGGGGVVGQAAIQLARLAGARRVIAAARSDAARARAAEAGADAVVALGSGAGTSAERGRDTGPDSGVGTSAGSGAGSGVGTSAGDAGAGVAELTRRLAEAADGPVDLVLDPLWGVPAAAAAGVLRSGGRLVNLGDAAGPTSPLSSAVLRSRSLSVLGYTNNDLSPADRTEAVTHIAALAASGRVRVAHETVPLSGVTAAWERQLRGEARGRIVLVPDPGAHR